MSISRQQIAQILSTDIATVKFTKVSGAERVMHCTIAPHLIPESKQPKGEFLAEYPQNLAVMRVFDVDLNEWRSFRVDAVKEVSFGSDDSEGNESQVLLG